MPFNTDQPNYQSLRKIFSERTKDIVLFCGAGLSRSAGTLSWIELRDALVEVANRHLAPRNPDEIKKEKILLDLAKIEPNLWLAFKHLKEVLKETTYHAEMRRLFPEAPPPKIYELIWKLPAVDGCITLNIDGLLPRGFAAVYGGSKSLTNYCGIDSHRHQDVLASGNKFHVNLHGIINDTRSWIFTSDEKDTLFSDKSYQTFLRSLFSSRTVVFIGITADDEAISAHLEYLKSVKFQGDNHYWITNRSDLKTIGWADEHRIRPIIYSQSSPEHPEVIEILEDLLKYKSVEPAPAPIIPSITKEKNFSLPAPDALEEKKAEEIRQILNKEALRILCSGTPDRLEKYNKFWEQYDEAIHRAWSASPKAGKNIFMGSTIHEHIKKGGFGNIYSATSKNNNLIALKVLHGVAKDDKTVLQSFRRGVEAMKILSKRKIDGIVPYTDAWEIPPSAAMEFIDGPNLEEAVTAGRIKEWPERIKISLNIVRIIRDAHAVPEGVLHRDIRPANIMLSDLWANEVDYKIYVLDFDLAWHKDATGHSISITHAANGYLAPELTVEKTASSRSALVDSYGIGMTLFFIATARPPLFSESSFNQWEQTLQSEIGKQIFTKWKSIPRRFSRIIYWASKPDQKERWDVGRIEQNLLQLQIALTGPSNIQSAELFAEEILARSNEGHNIYAWNADTLTGSFELRTGFSIEIKADESSKEITFACDWSNTGDRQFSSVKKYISIAADNIESLLKSGNWNITYRDHYSSNVRITAVITVIKLRQHNGLTAAAEAVNKAIEELKIN